MLESADLRFFSILADSSSLADAARILNVTASAVSQRLSLIEGRLGLRLVERGLGRMQMTDEGHMLLARSRTILSELNQVSEDLANRRGLIEGPLRIIAPLGFGRRFVAPAIAKFAIAHPAVTPELMLADDLRGEMFSGRWDLLVNVGRLPDAKQLQRKLAPNRRLLCAAPAYLAQHGNPAEPDDLRHHSCGALREDNADAAVWSFKREDRRRQNVRFTPRFACNDGDVMTAWSIAGLGIIERSEWNVSEHIAKGELVEILPDWRLENAAVIALMNPRSLRAARITAIANFLAEGLSPPPWRESKIAVRIQAAG
jgi:DNA-binding transcriptional LysR family regulator